MVQRSTEWTTRWLSLQGSCANRSRISSSEAASTAWAVRTSSPSGPPEAVLDQPVHEGRVLLPAGLLLERLGVVVVGAGAAQDDEEHHRGGSILSGWLKAR